MSKWVNQFRSKVKKMLPHSRKRVLDETYDIKDTLGGGIFSVVKKAVNRKTGELVAIKIYEKSRLTSYDRDCTTTEVELLKSLKHPNIISVRDCIDTRSKLYLVEELMTGGDLLEAIRKKKVFSEKEACRVFIQIMTAIAYLHANGIAHRDIKPDNILLNGDSEDPVVKLADFGFAKKVGSGILHTPCGSPVYTAPEIVREDSYDKSVDVWSAGVLLYLLLCGYPPFYHQDPTKLFEEIKKAVFDFPPEQWSTVSDSAKDLVSAMLKADPTERITAQQVLDHPWTVMMRTESVESTKPETPPPTPPPIPSTTSTSSSPSHSRSRSHSHHRPSSPSHSHHMTSTTSASAADSVMDRKLFKIRVNKALEQGTQFNLCPATSSSLWERRRKSKFDKSEKYDKNDKSDKTDKSESDKSNKSEKGRRPSVWRENRVTTTTTSTTGGEDAKKRAGIARSDSKEDRSEDRSEMLSTIDAYSLSRSSSDTSEDGFSFLTNNGCSPCD